MTRESGASAGEFEIVPDKTSEDAFQALRVALESVWSGLIFDPDGVSRLRGQLPSPHKLWRAIEKPVRDIAAEPRSILTRGEGVRRLEAVRKPSELTSGVIRVSAAMASRAGPNPDGVSDRNAAARADWPTRPARTSLVVREVAIPENALVAETLRRLAAYARRQPDGLTVATLANRALREQPFVSCGPFRGATESALARTLHDQRYRQIAKVLRLLNRPEAHATEGPGEARLGVKGMIRLYEYWVFLQVLVACRKKYGPPIEAGFDVLGTRTASGTTRLEIPQGATVRFAGGVHVGFEPTISSSGRDWCGLENVPHPDNKLAQQMITPDVVMLRLGPLPSAVVFDAKYVGRHWVETEAARIHTRYSRIRLQGRPVVRHVLAVHPHEGIDYLWAGYGSVPMIPGEPVDLSNLLP
ncbi:MAG: hypothetical protein OXN44_03345 [Acidimicrobiaceae bacterium]|nr:hypothetical protein [Acidimicrobiaceae bacterium]MDE0605636.1 hypothetical protein [Acidimicrobiaceae bacterium]